MLAEGDKIPQVAALDDAGAKVTTDDLLGKTLVVYFYPKDDTPGCTSEAHQFRDAYAKFKKKGADIVGVSRDSVASHRSFKEKYNLPYRLLADVDSTVCDAFGTIVEKNAYGKKTVGIQRSTFLIDESGTVVRVWPRVSVEGHADDVLAAIS